MSKESANQVKARRIAVLGARAVGKNKSERGYHNKQN